MYGKRRVLIAGLIVLLLIPIIDLVGMFITGWRPFQRSPRVPPPAAAASKAYDEAAALKEAEKISPKMIGYREAGGFAVPFREARALAVDSQDRIYVAGDRGVAIFSADGAKLSEIPLNDQPQCLAVGSAQHIVPGQLYVGMTEHVDVYDAKGEHVSVWPSQGTAALFTSIATTDDLVFVADAGNRVVWCYDFQGKPQEPIGKSRGEHGETEFVVPSHYFDVAAGHDGLIYVVNPRLLRVEGYTISGERETTWGKGSPAVADFFGCCNPAHLAVLPGGNFVTAEKGIPRVKIYNRAAALQTVVAGPSQLSDVPAAIAGDHRGRVLVLDARAAKVRVFEKTKPEEKKR